VIRRRALALLALVAACVETSAPPPAGAPRPPPLEGTRWELVDLDADPAARAPTLEFAAENRAGGYTGCNQWFAQVELSNGVRFGGIGATRRACPEPAMTTEREFLAVLEQTRMAEREGDALRLTGGEAETLATFRRAP
jgi:putative lipoprotein